MRLRPRGKGTGALLPLLLPVLAASSAPAQEREWRDETERWIPSFSIFGGVLFQDSDGIASSGTILPLIDQGVGEVCPDPPNFDPPGPSGCDAWPGLVGESLRYTSTLDPRPPPPGDPNPTGIIPIGSAIDDELLVTPFVIGSIELMTPGLQFLPSRPRLFAHGDAGGSFAFTRDVAREGSPGDIKVVQESPLDLVFVPEVEGQGSTVRAEVKPLLVSAGVGVAFTLDWGERRIRIKPSVEYLREEIEVTGLVASPIALTDPDLGAPNPRQEGPGPNPQGDRRDPADDYRLVSLSADTEKVFHGLGPGLEIELDAVRTGPFVLAVYVSGQAYNFFGDLEVKLSDSNEFGESADWSFEKERWGFRTGVGLRFRYLPEGGWW